MHVFELLKETRGPGGRTHKFFLQRGDTSKHCTHVMTMMITMQDAKTVWGF